MFVSLKWKMTLPIVLVVMLIIGSFAAFIYSSAKKSIDDQGMALVESIAIGLESASKAREVSERIMEQEMIAESVLLSFALAQGANHEDLKRIAEKAGLDELWSTDAQGNTAITSIAPVIDFNFGADPDGQAYEYMKLLTGEETTIVQPAQIRTVDNEFYKFVGVGGWNPNYPQIIQVARNGQMLIELEEQIGSTFFMQQVEQHLGKSVLFAAVVDETGEALAATSTESLSSIGFSATHFTGNEELTSFSSTFMNNKATNYIKRLADGNYLAITVSNKILSEITLATIISSIAAILIISAIALFINAKQVKRILQVRHSLVEISQGEGDLTKRITIETKDEIGQLVSAFNGMLENFQQIMQELKVKSQAVSQSTDEIHSTMLQVLEGSTAIQVESEKVADGSQTQLSSMQNSSQAIEDMAKGIQHITDSVLGISMTSKETETDALSGSKMLGELVKQLSVVSTTAEKSVERMEELVYLSNEIDEFIHVITSIAEQTNLLALNASIEAARAGESGKGFAVVATEVRKLAEESKVSAEKIAGVALNVQRETTEVVDGIHKVVEDLSEGTDIANEVHLSFTEILQRIQYIAGQVENVSSASEEMAAGSEEIAATFGEISDISDQTFGRAGQMVASSANQSDNIAAMSRSIKLLYQVSQELKVTTDKYQV